MTEENYTGDQIARVVDCWLEKSSKKETPGIFVQFKINGSNKNVKYTGWISDATEERIVESILKAGFKGARIEDVAKGVSMFDENADIPIHCKMEEYTNNQGEIKSFLKVAWIGSSIFKNKLEHGEIVETFKGMSINGTLLRMRNEMGLGSVRRETTKTDEPSEEQAAHNFFTADDIPF